MKKKTKLLFLTTFLGVVLYIQLVSASIPITYVSSYAILDNPFGTPAGTVISGNVYSMKYEDNDALRVRAYKDWTNTHWLSIKLEFPNTANYVVGIVGSVENFGGDLHIEVYYTSGSPSYYDLTFTSGAININLDESRGLNYIIIGFYAPLAGSTYKYLNLECVTADPVM